MTQAPGSPALARDRMALGGHRPPDRGPAASGAMGLSAGQPTSELQHDDVVELTPLLRRVIGARVRDRHVVEDLVQEALARVMAARQRLEPRALAPYAVVTARNLTRSLATSEQRSRRHAHRLIDLREPVSPEEEALRREESRAIATALGKLPEQDQEALVAHEVEGRTRPRWRPAGTRPPVPSRPSSAGRGRDSGSSTSWSWNRRSRRPPAAARCCWPCPPGTDAASGTWTPVDTCLPAPGAPGSASRCSTEEGPRRWPVKSASPSAPTLTW